MEQVLKYVTVFGGSMFKFIFGIVTGEATGMPVWLTVVLTVAGMMTSVVVFSHLGMEIRRRWMLRFRKVRPRFTRSNRRMVAIWSRYGLGGVAFLTPLLFSPIVGTILALSFGESPKRIVGAMFLSAIFWGTALTVGLHLFRHQFIS